MKLPLVCLYHRMHCLVTRISVLLRAPMHSKVADPRTGMFSISLRDSNWPQSRDLLKHDDFSH